MSLLGWVSSFIRDVVFRLFFALLLASLLSHLFFEREYRYRLEERVKHLQQCVEVILAFLYFPLVNH